MSSGKIFQSDHKISFVLYQNQKAPKYYEIDKKVLRFVFIIIPAISLLCLFLAVVPFAYFQDIRQNIKISAPTIVEELQKENLELKTKLQQLEADAGSIAQKLTSQSFPSIGHLRVFKATPAEKDLSASARINIENFEAKLTSANTIRVNFNVANAGNQDEKITGHLFVLHQEGNSIQVYPENSFDDEGQFVLFNRGEAFMTYRFRPFQVEFSHNPKLKNSVFRIIIMTKSGDFLFQKTFTQSFNP